ncbi:YutD-like domain-containing protein, partial [Enterococcus cecorum]|uniref:YutD-like domain-containing protein n=1 Tax=Enterococcus cecorum TaxID=44008 RepID=UPI001FABA0C2
MTNQETQQEVQTTQEQAAEEKVEYKGEVVTQIEENKYQVGSRQYELVANHRDGFDAQKFGERYSDCVLYTTDAPDDGESIDARGRLPIKTNMTRVAVLSALNQYKRLFSDESVSVS